MDSLKTKKEAADRLKVSTRTIDRLRARETLRYVTVGGQIRFRDSDLEAFIARNSQGMGA